MTQNETKLQAAHDSLMKAKTGQSAMNYQAIFNGFAAKGIPENEILPRENVFTFNAWRALGRTVKRGEHGVKVLTWISKDGKANQGDTDADKDAPNDSYKFAKSVTVFHVSQTELLTK